MVQELKEFESQKEGTPMSVKLPSSEIKKIAVFRALHLADLICSIPAIRALRSAYPKAEITLLGLPWASSFTKRFSQYFDRFIYFPGYSGLPEQEYVEEAFEFFLQRIQREKFDLLIQMHGSGAVVNSMMLQFRARYLAGYQNKESIVDSPFFIEYPNYGSEIKRHLLLMEHLGIRDEGAHLEFPITKKDEEELEELLLPLRNGKYVCINPGAKGSWRQQWPPYFYAMLADFCVENGFSVVITGSEEERDITREVRKCLRHSAIDLTGLANVGALAALIRDAAFLVSNATDVSHIAAAVETPAIVISMDGEPERWTHEQHKVIDWTLNPQLDEVLMHTSSLLDKQKIILSRLDNYPPFTTGIAS